MSYIGDGIARAMVGAMVGLVICTVFITAALIFGIPWLWHLLKPLLHSITG